MSESNNVTPFPKASSAQRKYEEWVETLTGMIHSPNQFGLLYTHALYSELLRQFEAYEGRLEAAAPLLLPMGRSVENEVVLTLAKFVEPSGAGDSNRGLSAFLEWLLKNADQLSWGGRPIEVSVIESQVELLHGPEHAELIQRIRQRRDKYVAHFDKRYFTNPEKLYEECPLGLEETERLINVIIKIVGRHQRELPPSTFPFHIAEFVPIHVAKMVEVLVSGHSKREDG